MPSLRKTLDYRDVFYFFKLDLVQIYLLQPDRTEIRGRDVGGGGEGRGGTGAMRKTIHINKVRFADVKQLLFTKFTRVKNNNKQKSTVAVKSL